jgi:hypothetical protein
MSSRPPARHRRQRRQVVAELAAGEEQEVDALGRGRQADGVEVGPGDATSAGILDAQRQAREIVAEVEQRREVGGGEAAEALRPQILEIDEEPDDREGRGPLRVRPHVVEDGLVRHAVEHDFRDREGFPRRAQAFAEPPQLRPPAGSRIEAAARGTGGDVPRASFAGRAIEEQLLAEARRHALVPEEEPVDVSVLAGAGGERPVDARDVVLLDLAMADRLDRAEHRGPEQLAGAGGEGGRGPLADLAQDHVGAGPLQRGGAAFEVDDEHGCSHDRDQAGDQEPLRREPPPPGRRQRGPGAGTGAPSRRDVERDGGTHDVGERGALHAVGVARRPRREPDAPAVASVVPDRREPAARVESRVRRCRFP